MMKCVRCKRDMGLGSGIITKVSGDAVHMVHFFCATRVEVEALYGDPKPFEFPVQEPQKR